MHRFSVIYLLKRQYHHIYCTTHSEAEAVLSHLLSQQDCKPIGIYDAKTELFGWEPTRQHQYNRASIEKQGKLGDHIIQMAQTLRQHDGEHQSPSNSIAQLLQMDSTGIEASV